MNRTFDSRSYWLMVTLALGLLVTDDTQLQEWSTSRI